MTKTKSRSRKGRKSQQGSLPACHVNAQNLPESTPDTLDSELKKKKRSELKKKKRSDLRKKKRWEMKKKKRMVDQDKLETAGKMTAETRSWKGKMEELVKLLAGHKLDGVDNERKGIQSGRGFMRSLRELQVWEVEKIKPGQIVVACPVCKLERLHEKCNQAFRNLRNHLKREHKRLKFYLVRSRCLKCPICLEIVSACQLGVHFGLGRPCEKDLLVDEHKEEGSEETPGGSGPSNS